MAAFSTGLYYAGISMGYLYLMMGVIVSSAVLPATLTLLWSRQNLVAAALSPVLGLICAIIAWLVTASKESGELTVDTTGANNPMLAGNVVALLSPLIFVPVLTFAFGPANYDWQSMKAIRKGDDSEIADAAHIDMERVPGAAALDAAAEEAEHKNLMRASKIAGWTTVGMTLALLILWPMPLYGSGYVFSKKFFTGWVVVGIMWLGFSACCVGIFPLWEGRQSMTRTARAIWRDINGKGIERRGVLTDDREESDSASAERNEGGDEKPAREKVGAL